MKIIFYIPVLKNVFDTFDLEKKGLIGTDMIGSILEALGHTLDDKALKALVHEVDEDDTGELDFEEFALLASRFVEVEEDVEAVTAELREAFRLYDKEGKGYLTVAVFREILRELDDKLSKDDLDQMIEEIDADGSGTVDFEGMSTKFLCQFGTNRYEYFIFQSL